MDVTFFKFYNNGILVILEDKYKKCFIVNNILWLKDS